MNSNPVTELNKLGRYDYLEAAPLINQCLEKGLYQWTSPLFVVHLRHQIQSWSMGVETFMRSVIYARHLAEIMPSGIDDETRCYFQRLGTGQVGEDDYPISCLWPRVYTSIWNPKLFWIGREIQASRSEAVLFETIYANRRRENRKLVKDIHLTGDCFLHVNWNQKLSKAIVGINKHGKIAGSRHAFGYERLAEAAAFVRECLQLQGEDYAGDIRAQIESVIVEGLKLPGAIDKPLSSGERRRLRALSDG